MESAESGTINTKYGSNTNTNQAEVGVWVSERESVWVSVWVSVCERESVSAREVEGERA